MSERFDVLIVGAGVAGSACAILLAFKAHFQHTRLEAGTLPVFLLDGVYGGMVLGTQGPRCLPIWPCTASQPPERKINPHKEQRRWKRPWPHCSGY